MELFGKQVLGNGGGRGIKQDICVLLGSENCVWVHVRGCTKVVEFECVLYGQGRKQMQGRVITWSLVKCEKTPKH